MTAADRQNQASFHRALFAKLYDWQAVWSSALEFAGDPAAATRLALDQLGHFGPPGVALVIDRMLAHADGRLRYVLELGSGFGGALRQAQRLLGARGFDPLLVGVELVPEHCALARTMSATMGAEDAVAFVGADVAALPFRSQTIDAVLAAGSASHFGAMDRTLAECGRVLRGGGLFVAVEEVSLRPPGAPAPGPVFVRTHPAPVFHTASADLRHRQLERAGLSVLVFEPLRHWALPLLRQRVRALRLLGHCGQAVFGARAYDDLIATLDSAADEYERESVQPALIVARR